MIVHLHRPSSALLWLGSLEAIRSHGLQDIRENQWKKTRTKETQIIKEQDEPRVDLFNNGGKAKLTPIVTLSTSRSPSSMRTSSPLSLQKEKNKNYKREKKI